MDNNNDGISQHGANYTTIGGTTVSAARNIITEQRRATASQWVTGELLSHTGQLHRHQHHRDKNALGNGTGFWSNGLLATVGGNNGGGPQYHLGQQLSAGIE